MAKHKGWILSGIATAAAALPAVVYAQVNPSALERTVPKIPDAKQPEVPNIETPEAPVETAVPTGESFILGAVQIEGASVYDSAELAKIFEPFLASMVDRRTLDRIAADITDRYRRDGYFLSYAFVPEQSVQSGVTRIKVVEGFVGAVEVEGAGGEVERAVRSFAGNVVSTSPLTKSTLDRTLALIGDLPGVVVTDAKLGRDGSNPARHVLTLAVAPDRTALFTFVDNRGTVGGARLRGYLAGNVTSLVVPGDQLQLEAFVIPGDDFHFLYGKARQSLPLGNDGLRLAISASAGKTFQRLEETQRGQFRQLTAALSYPVVNGRELAIFGHVSIEDWNSRESIDGTISQRDQHQLARFTATLLQPSPARFDVRLGLSRGLDGRSPGTGTPLSRSGADPQFTKLNADATIVASASDDLSVRFELAGQYSPDVLVGSEEFALGGSRIGRAFDFNAATGDYGAGGLVELSYQPGEAASWIQRFELFAYLDGGWARRRSTSTEAGRKQWLTGAGLGSRFSVAGFALTGELGKPIDSHLDSNSVRVFFSAARAF